MIDREILIRGGGLGFGRSDAYKAIEQFSANGLRLGLIDHMPGTEAKCAAVGQQNIEPIVVDIDERALQVRVRRRDVECPIDEIHAVIVSRNGGKRPPVRSARSGMRAEFARDDAEWKAKRTIVRHSRH